jgi:polyphenol oxidase
MESKTMKLQDRDGVKFFTFPQLETLGFIKHGFSTRYGGVSEGHYRWMNLSFSNGDDKVTVLQNFQYFAKALGVDLGSMVLSDQDHGVVIRRVRDQDRGKGIIKEKDYRGVDALITNVPGITLITQHADCVPLFFTDSKNKAVGMAHSGWRGTWGEMAKKTVTRMKEEFGTDPKELYVGIGPSIGPCCFEVEMDVLEKLQELTDWRKEDVVFQGEGKYRVDLWQLNKRMLQSAGVPESRIFVTDLCTQCHPDVFFSHRVHGRQRGSLAGMISIAED